MQVPAAELRRIAESPNPRVALRELLARRPAAEPRPQLALWVRDAEDLPERPWRIHPDDVFDCVTLNCKGMKAGLCVMRQQVTDAQRTQQTSRGQGTRYPACDTRKCAQGRGIREALDPDADVAFSGAGPGGRFQRERPRGERKAQRAAKRDLARAGLLDEVRILDIDPDPVAE